MAKVTKIKYFTEEKKKLISDENKKLYDKYLKSNIIKNREVEDTTYGVYANNMSHFMVFIAENYDNIGLYSEEFMKDAVDIMEDYISFCQETLQNNKKTINNKLAAVSSFYGWSMKRKYIPFHPFDKRLDRMKGAKDEKIINSYFLTEEEIETVKKGLEDEKKFDIQDKILFYLAIDSANRIGALSKLTLSSMDIDEMVFKDIREKRGKRVEVVFEEKTRELIEEWLFQRKDDYDKMEVDSLFIAKYKEWIPMGKSSLQERIKKIGTIIGLSDFHAHCTRKSAINLIVEKTGDISLGAEIANHESVETTRQSYVKPRSKAQTRNKIKELIKEKDLAKKQIKENEDALSEENTQE
jgi:integrase/recombinase XerC